MKYIIDVEKIEGINLWKAKEFNTLVFDKNGLMKMMTLEDELGDYYDVLRNEIYDLRRKLSDSEIEVVEDLRKENKRLWEKVCEEKHERTWWKHFFDEKERDFNILKKENEKLKEYNYSLEKERKDYDNICSRLKKENKELKQRCKFQDIERLRKSIVKLIEENEILNTELKKWENKYE